MNRQLIYPIPDKHTCTHEYRHITHTPSYIALCKYVFIYAEMSVFSWGKDQQWSRPELCSLVLGIGLYLFILIFNWPSPGQKDNCKTTSQFSHGAGIERVVIKIRSGTSVTLCLTHLKDSLLHNCPLELVKLMCAKDIVVTNGRDNLVQLMKYKFK